MKFYKLLAVILLAVMLLGVVACGNDPTDTNKGTTPKDPTVTTPTDSETGRDAVKDSVPEDLNFSGRNDNTVTFFVRSNVDLFAKEICVEELTNDILYDAIYYRNIDVEDRLGVTIRSIGQPGSETNSDWLAWNETLSTAVLTNTHDYDAAAIHTYCGSVLALQNIFADLTTLQDPSEGGYLDLSKPWWHQDSIEALTIYGSLFFVGGDMMITVPARTYAIFFNKDLFAEKFPEENCADLYQSVKDGNWTIDKLSGYVAQVWTDVNASGDMDDGDVAGWVYGAQPSLSIWAQSLGLDFITRDQYGDMQLSYIYDSNIVPAFEALSKLYNPDADGVLGGQKWAETKMEAGNVLFTYSTLSGGEAMRDSAVSYGVLPMPKFNAEQDEYRTSFLGQASALAICSDITAERRAIVTATCELLCAESYKSVVPAYYGKVLQGLYSKDQPDAEMYDMIVDTIVYDFGTFMFPKSGTVLKSYTGLFGNARTSGYDIAHAISSNTTAWENALADMMEAFDTVIG